MKLFSGRTQNRWLVLRILGNMASEITYVHSLETNNVILRFSASAPPTEEAPAGAVP